MATRVRSDSLLDLDEDVPLGSTPALEPTRSPAFYSTGLNPSFTVPATSSTDFALEDDEDDERTPVPSPARSERAQDADGELYLPGLTSLTLFGVVPEVSVSLLDLRGLDAWE